MFQAELTEAEFEETKRELPVIEEWIRNDTVFNLLDSMLGSSVTIVSTEDFRIKYEALECEDKLSSSGLTSYVGRVVKSYRKGHDNKGRYMLSRAKLRYCVMLYMRKPISGRTPRPKEVSEKSPEGQVRAYIASIGLISTQNDARVKKGKHTKTRPDIVFERDDRCVIIEVDENQHTGYGRTSEISRMITIGRIYCKKTVFLRFNPDSYISFEQIPLEQRYAVLGEDVKRFLYAEHLDNLPDVSAVYLYYDYKSCEDIHCIEKRFPSEIIIKHSSIVELMGSYVASKDKRALSRVTHWLDCYRENINLDNDPLAGAISEKSPETAYEVIVGAYSTRLPESPDLIQVIQKS